MPEVERTQLALFFCALLLAGCAAPRGGEPLFPHNECDPALPDPCVAQLVRHAAVPARQFRAQVDRPHSVQ